MDNENSGVFIRRFINEFQKEHNAEYIYNIAEFVSCFDEEALSVERKKQRNMKACLVRMLDEIIEKHNTKEESEYILGVVEVKDSISYICLMLSSSSTYKDKETELLWLEKYREEQEFLNNRSFEARISKPRDNFDNYLSLTIEKFEALFSKYNKDTHCPDLEINDTPVIMFPDDTEDSENNAPLFEYIEGAIDYFTTSSSTSPCKIEMAALKTKNNLSYVLMRLEGR